jgi:hypothetical protein
VTIQIGRVGADITIGGPSSVSLDGDVLSLSGTAKSLASVGDWTALRDQFRGLVGNLDEPVVPITFSTDPSLNGFYTDLRVAVPTDPGGWANQHFGWQVQATRLIDFAYPLVEATLMGGFRTNAVGIVAASPTQPWWCNPPAFFDLSSAVVGATAGTRTGADGTVSKLFVDATPPATPMRVVNSYTARSDHWYDNSCSIKWLYGSNLRTVVGRQVPAITTFSGGIPVHVGQWQLLSGGLRVTPTLAAGKAAFTVEVWSGAAWQSVGQFAIQNTASQAYQGFTSFTVTRCSTESCSVRVGLYTQTIDDNYSSHYAYVDLNVRRGSRLVECVLADTFSLAGKVVVVDTGANFTGGQQRSADDGNGNRWIMLSPAAVTKVTVSPASITQTTPGPTFSFALGAILKGSTAATLDTQAAVTSQYFGPYTERTAFVGR